MSDRLLQDEEIDAFCTCRGATKDVAVEFQVPDGEGYRTVFYHHIDCPLHGVIRHKRGEDHPLKGPAIDDA